MAIINRDLDASQQKDVLQFAAPGGVATGVTLQCVAVPYPATLQAIQVSAVGISGSPTYGFGIGRFIAGAGYTFIVGGATTITARAVGTSGPVAASLAASGSTLLSLQSGDVLCLLSAGANSAVAQLNVSFVVQALQDYKTMFGV